MADRYLLESGAPDGYLLEDGSGVLLQEIPVVKASRFASAGAGSGSKLYRTTALPDAATGVLVSAWVKIADWTTSPPYDRHNDYTFWIDATNWQVVCINGNLFGTSSTDNAVYNANSGFRADATGFGDTTAYIQQFMPEVQNLDYVWVCWQVIAPPNSDVTLRQWLRFGLEMPLIFREEIMTLAAIRAATGNGTWSAGALTQITIGDNHDGDAGVYQDIMRVRWEQYGSLPSDAKLSAIAALDAADATAWGDYLLDFSNRTADRSGNGRTLTESGTITEGGAFNNIANDPYVVQAKDKTSGSTSSLAETFSATPSVGNTVLIRGTARSAGTITASDNQGNTYTVYANAPASGHKSFVIVAPITTASGTFTVTVSGLGTTSTQYQLEELQGAYNVDWSSLPATQSAGLTVNAPSANTSEAIVFGVCCPVTAGVTVYNPGGGYKSITGQDGDNGILLAKLSAAGVTESITYPAPDVGNISGILVGLVRSAGGGGATENPEFLLAMLS